jgi:hypothetical protein
MPGVYREKECPVCEKKHRKRGIFCGQSCANKQREYTEETKEKISKSVGEHFLSPEGITSAIWNNRRVHALREGKEIPVNGEEYVVDIPTIHDIPKEYMPNDLWHENNDIDDNF